MEMKSTHNGHEIDLAFAGKLNPGEGSETSLIYGTFHDYCTKKSGGLQIIFQDQETRLQGPPLDWPLRV